LEFDKQKRARDKGRVYSTPSQASTDGRNNNIYRENQR